MWKWYARKIITKAIDFLPNRTKNPSYNPCEMATLKFLRTKHLRDVDTGLSRDKYLQVRTWMASTLKYWDT